MVKILRQQRQRCQIKQDNRVAKNEGRDPNGPNKTFDAFEEVSNNIIDLPSLIEKTLPKLILSSGAQLFGDNSLCGQIFWVET
jgi:hypothetical protein